MFFSAFRRNVWEVTQTINMKKSNGEQIRGKPRKGQRDENWNKEKRRLYYYGLWHNERMSDEVIYSEKVVRNKRKKEKKNINDVEFIQTNRKY